ncbi:hypothetical protein C8J57DRAFT_1080606, partial [Mycena rebaudengoi]
MPADIEKRLEKRVRQFLWAEKEQVTVNKETVYAPADVGGKDLLDIVSRNEAIAITWLKTYLNFSENRPLWCFVADELLAKKIQAGDINVDVAMRLNAYLQTWKPKVGDDMIGKDLTDMIKAGRKYGVQMDVIAVSGEIQRQMPVWYHSMSFGDKNLWNKPPAVVECLKKKHRIKLVKDAEALADKMNAPNHSTTQPDCGCGSCSLTRAITGCEHPGKCYKKCKALLDVLEEKWDPRYAQPEDYEDDIAPQPSDDPDTVEFDPRITTHGTIGDTFRIFTQDKEVEYTYAPDTQHEAEPDEQIEIYTDGSALNNGMANAMAGAGVFFGDDDLRNISVRIPDELGPSNQTAEMIGVKVAVEIAPKTAPL